MRLFERMRRKAVKHHKTCTFHVVAVAFNHKGDMIGLSMNRPAPTPNYRGRHAEAVLINRYGRKISKIVIARFGNSGDPLPIDPCPQCKALAARFGITIEPFNME